MMGLARGVGSLAGSNEEVLKYPNEPRCGRNEVTRSRSDDPFGVQLVCECVTDSLERLGMTPRGNHRRDPRLTHGAQPRARIARRPAAMGAPHAASYVLRKGPFVDVRGARDLEKLAQNSRVSIEAFREYRIAQTRQVLDLPIVGHQVEERRLDQRQ
jgi:hypothetical protein